MFDYADEPAIVRGNIEDAVAFFVEDARGDLVDVEYYCTYCAPGHEHYENRLPWPGYEFPADYSVHCGDCSELLNEVRQGAEKLDLEFEKV